MATNILSNTRSFRTDSNNGYPDMPITATITNGFFTVDQKWTVKYWNKAAEKLLGVRAEDILGKNLWEKFAGVIPVNFYEVYYKAFQQDIPLHFEEYWGEMGAWFDVVTYHCDDTLSVSFKSSNHPAYSEQSAHPAQELKILNELYRYVTEVTNDCLWEWDLLDGELFWIDGGHERVLGYPIRNALIPQDFWESCLHPEDKVRVLKRLYRIILKGTDSVWDEEYRFKKADGSYAYVHDRAHIIYDEERAAVRMIGATQDITVRKAAEIQLLENRKDLTDAVLTAQENERSAIGRELHDNLNQILGAAKLYIELAKTDEANRTMCLDKSSGYIVQVIEEIRRISKTLATPGIHIMGLLESIEILIDDLQTVDPVKIEFYEQDIVEEDMTEKLQLDIFRIVQEQLNNILKHAQATRATIYLTREADDILLIISDNGMGWDILKENKGVGIINIKSRAELHHGKVTITSRPGDGYKLKVVLPLDQ